MALLELDTRARRELRALGPGDIEQAAVGGVDGGLLLHGGVDDHALEFDGLDLARCSQQVATANPEKLEFPLLDGTKASQGSAVA